MDIETKMQKLKEELTEINVREMSILTNRIDNHLDENGKCILDEFPYLVELLPPIVDEKYDGFLDWLDEHIKEDEFTREWVSLVYFKNEEDAMAFKLRWT